jgi:hypothetical protein
MTKQKLDGSEVSAGFKEMNGEGVAQGMRSDRLVDTEELTRLPAGMCDSKTADRLIGDIAWEQPFLWLFRAPITAQDLQKFGREHDITVFPPFALLHADNHPLTVNGSSF